MVKEIKEGDWVDAYGGYGVVVKIVPKYYEYWHERLPEGKKIGDKDKDIVLLKRFCSHDFKVRPQTTHMSISLVSKITKKDMATIAKMLKDEKVASKFEKYRVEDDFMYVVNWDQDLPESTFEKVSRELQHLENNGNLNMTMREIERYFKESFNIELFSSPKYPNCYIQLGSGFGMYRGKEMLFKQIGIQNRN